MVDTIFEKYEPIDLKKDEIQIHVNKIKALPKRKRFDMQFSSVQSAINAKIKKVYSVRKEIDITIKDAIDNIDEIIYSGRDENGELYLKIKVDSAENEIYKQFLVK